jgi:ligand-binding SRPBCC domain-containing protein
VFRRGTRPNACLFAELSKVLKEGFDVRHCPTAATYDPATIMHYELVDSFEVGADLDRAWRFFGTAENLPKITPPWLRFTLETPGAGPIGQDSILDYTIRWMGIPVKWRTQIIDWSPPRQFVDLQVRGPYALWHHQHRFEATSGGVACFDRVIYKLPLPIVGSIVHATMVKRQLLEIFRYRRMVIGEHLGGIRPLQEDVRIARL